MLSVKKVKNLPKSQAHKYALSSEQVSQLKLLLRKTKVPIKRKRGGRPKKCRLPLFHEETNGKVLHTNAHPPNVTNNVENLSSVRLGSRGRKLGRPRKVVNAAFYNDQLVYQQKHRVSTLLDTLKVDEDSLEQKKFEPAKPISPRRSPRKISVELESNGSPKPRPPMPKDMIIKKRRGRPPKSLADNLILPLRALVLSDPSGVNLGPAIKARAEDLITKTRRRDKPKRFKEFVNPLKQSKTSIKVAKHAKISNEFLTKLKPLQIRLHKLPDVSVKKEVDEGEKVVVKSEPQQPAKETIDCRRNLFVNLSPKSSGSVKNDAVANERNKLVNGKNDSPKDPRELSKRLAEAFAVAVQTMNDIIPAANGDSSLADAADDSLPSTRSFNESTKTKSP